MSVAVLSLIMIISVSRSRTVGARPSSKKTSIPLGRFFSAVVSCQRIVERKAALFDLTEGLHQDGDLEHAAHRKDAPGVEFDPPVGLQMSGADAHLGAAVLDDLADLRFKSHKLFLAADGATVHPGYGMKFLR